MNSLNRQVAGTHYLNITYQPVQLTFDVNGTCTFCKVAKYISREKDDMVEQINKAIHCVELEKDLLKPHTYYPKGRSGTWAATKCIENFSNQFVQREIFNIILMSMMVQNYELATQTLLDLRSTYE